MKTAKNWWAAFGYILMGALATAGAGLVMSWVLKIAREKGFFLPEVALTILVVMAVLAFLIVLSTVAAVLAALNLADPRHALGMPEGSVRAVIALSLLLTFVTVSMFLFNQLETSYMAEGLAETQFNTLLEEHPERIVDFEKDGEVYNVRLRTEVGETSRLFATELLSILGTLVGTVSGFYFGTKALTAARGIAVAPGPSIKSIKPKVGEAEKEIPVKISGKDFDGPVVVKLVRGSTTILEVKDPPCSSKEIACTFKLEKIAPGICDLVVVNQDGAKDQEDEAFTVTVVPEVTGISPDKGKDKVSVKIQGKNFVKGVQVKLKQAGQADVPVTVEDKDVTPTEIACSVDLTDKTGTWDVIVINPGEKEGKSPKPFTVEAATPPAPAAPTVEGIEPPAGKAAEGEVKVTITGTGLTKEAKVELRKEGQNPVKAKGEVEVVEAGKKIKCTFDLKDKVPGDWDVAVKVGEKEVTKEKGFKVE